MLYVLPTAAAVVTATDGDPWARSAVHDGATRGWAYRDAVGWRTDRASTLGVPEPRVSALGPPADVAAMLALLADAGELPDDTRATLPRGTPVLLTGPVRLPEFTDWDFRWTDVAPPPQPGEERAGWVHDDAAVSELLTLASPTASTQPGDPAIRRWCGIAAAGHGHGGGGGGGGNGGGEYVLAACAADTSRVPGIGHISSVATGPSQRGRGLGVAVTGWLTRRLLEEFDVVTLGMYAGNVAGRRLYGRLGYRDEHHFSSGMLIDPGQRG